MQITDLVFIDPAGYHYEDFPTFQQWVQDQYRGIYGDDVYLGSDSQDGQWLAILAQAFFDLAAHGAATYNSFSPAIAQGAGLARNVKINGIRKRSATHSTVELVIVGVAGTVLTNSVAVDALQQKWSIPNCTIPNSGTIMVTATAVDQGAIQALPNTINGLFTPTQGWQTVNNAAAATPGVAVEQDAELRTRQGQSVALPSLTVFEGTVAAVKNVSGVVAAKGYENDTGSTDGDGLPAHSIALVVQGGIDTDIASAIRVKKTPGTRTYGTTSVPLYDSHGMPITINFFRPTNATINVEVTITHLQGWDNSYKALIEDAIAAYVAGIEIGDVIVLTKLYLAGYLIGTPQYGTFNIEQIKISKNADPLGTSDVVLEFHEIPVCDPSTDVTVTP